MKVEDSEQPKEIQELRAQARELAAKLDEEENEKI
jgi:hypothetical protein